MNDIDLSDTKPHLKRIGWKLVRLPSIQVLYQAIPQHTCHMQKRH